MPLVDGVYYCDDGGCGRCPHCVEHYAGKQEALRKWAEEHGIGVYVLPVIARCIAERIDFTTGRPLP